MQIGFTNSTPMKFPMGYLDAMCFPRIIKVTSSFARINNVKWGWV